MIAYLDGMGRERWLTHAGLLVVTLVGCFVASLYQPAAEFIEQITIGLGYVALTYLVITLLIGPWKLLHQRRNPVNINLRRDFGIWSGITGLLHVLFGFQVHMGGDIVQYFFERNPHHPDRIAPLTNLFGLSNDVGLIGMLILILLLVLSNDISLHWLRGPRWKWLQRANYLLFPFVVAHTLGYQSLINREPPLITAVVVASVITLLVQLSGLMLMLTRQRHLRAGKKSNLS